MKVILTGITGNLGHEVALKLKEKGIEIIPMIRSDRNSFFEHNQEFKEVILTDLVNNPTIEFSGKADCIVHCAGIVHFLKTEKQNEVMARNIVNFAERYNIPIYYVSTAYLYKPNKEAFNNEYEIDKNNAKKVIGNAIVPYTIINPSIIIGNSKTGEIQNLSGYYTVLSVIVKAIKTSESMVRLPKYNGLVNIIPVDQVAESITKLVLDGKIGEFFTVNPIYTSFEKIIGKSLEELGMRDRIQFLDCSLDQYEQMELTPGEEKLLNISRIFIPYWTVSYKFPNTIIEKGFDDQKDIKIMTDFYTKFHNE